MAGIERSGEFVACVCGSNVLVYTIGSTEKQIYELEKKSVVPKDSESSEKDQDKEGGDQESAGTDRILAAGFSPSGDHYATCDDNKNLTLWKTGEKWTQLSVRTLTRRCTSLRFSQSGSFLVVGDKSGDVYRFSLSKPEEPGVLKLGHVSMLLDVCLCGQDEEYVATADRDQKVRVSCFPNSYNIQAFCLGHNEFVSRLLYIREEDILVSGSGDGTVRLWEYSVGKQLHCESCHSTLYPKGQGSDQGQGQSAGDTENADVTRLSFYPKEKILAVGFERCKTILLYKLLSEKGKHSLQLYQEIHLDANVWDLTFDAQGDLWFVQEKKGGASVYRKQSGDEKFAAITEPEDDPMILTLAAINKDEELFNEAVSAQSVFASFHKPKMDSAHFYFEKKQQRLAEATKRRDATLQPSGEQSENQESTAKKAKLDSE